MIKCFQKQHSNKQNTFKLGIFQLSNTLTFSLETIVVDIVSEIFSLMVTVSCGDVVVMFMVFEEEWGGI